MRYEYLVLFVVVIMAWQNFSLRRKIKQLWQAMDKREYVSCYQALLHQSKDQAKAIKALRQKFPELDLLQAVEVSNIAHREMAVKINHQTDK
ncbi:hypothetical protein M2R47_00190 [Moraxella sp. Tifton1]|uniref:Uncharacterized protein n=1 Tax=Moraxella oculi TaxID=2940516 RepID=A0ABW8U343_9GAMM|nr:hypothetical protein [Moraxella sp. Tifton1]MCL1622675.1 hypothetical protein [Moraxella sp. Tifton1]